MQSGGVDANKNFAVLDERIGKRLVLRRLAGKFDNGRIHAKCLRR
jgi:hypothetical protein